MNVVLAQILPKAGDTSFEITVLKNIETANKIAINRLLNINDQEIRDRQMAENLKWLTKYRYPKEKIIVWAHSAHLAKFSHLIEGNSSIKKSMGSFFALDKKLIESTYVLGFTSRNGTAGRLTLKNKFNIQNPSNNDFESWFPKELKYGFVDFKGFNLIQPEFSTSFKMKGIAHSSNLAPWNKVFDGIFYIRDMYPAKKIED